MSAVESVLLAVVSGGSAQITEHDGDHVVLQSSVPSPPGSTLSLDHQSLRVLVKVRGCRRVTEEGLPFRIEGRLVSLTRAARAALFGPKLDAP